MKRTPLKRGTKVMKRSGFSTKTAPSLKKRSKAILGGNKRKPQTISALKMKLWVLCREIIRKRHGNVCFTCGRTGLEGGNWQTGHFIPSSICSVEMRYNLENLRPQCYHCNINLSGNWPAYEERLGKDKAEELKKENRLSTGKQYDILWYYAKIEEYGNHRKTQGS